MIKLRNLDSSLKQWIVSQTGIGPIGELFYLAKDGGNPRKGLLGYREDGGQALVDGGHMFATGPYLPYTASTTYGNDVTVVMPDSHVWTGDAGVAGTVLTWAKYCTHMIGMAPFSKGGGPRSRFGHSGYTMANFFTMSGWNNLFQNLYWMHGSATGAAADLCCGTITGAYNVFNNCHFGGPNDATQGATAGYRTLYLTGSQNYFKDCLVGSQNAIVRNAANSLLDIATGGNNVFEDCLFTSRSNGNTTAKFINISALGAASGGYRAMFLNTQFLHSGPASGSDLAVAITTVGLESSYEYLYFDNRCSFAGCTLVIVDGKEGIIKWGGAGANADTTAIGDDKNLGLAQSPQST